MEALLEESVPSDKVEQFKTNYAKELESGEVQSSTKFEYAYCLVRSKSMKDIEAGVDILENLCHYGEDSAKRDYLFYLAVANTRLGDYERALECVQTFLNAEPQNRQALELEKEIRSRITKDGLKGMLITGGAVAIVAVGTAAAIIGGLAHAGYGITKRMMKKEKEKEKN